MVLITGASGFLGQRLVRYLSAGGQRVRALYYNSIPTGDLASLPGVEWLQCDLLDVFAVAEAMEGVSQVYHCAAIVSFLPADREVMLHFNTESTANVVNQALEQGIKKMVYVSSVAALGRTGNEDKPITEEEEWGESGYNSAYGLSKYLAETEVWRGIGEGLNAVIINPGVILGAGNWERGSAQLMKVAYDEFPFYTTGSTSWVDADDVTQIMTSLMAGSATAERYIVSAGNYSYRHVFTLMAGALGRRPPRYLAGSMVTGIAWRLSMLKSAVTGANPVITRETAINAQGISIYKNEKLLAALPGFTYRPIEITIKNMAQAFLDSYKK